MDWGLRSKRLAKTWGEIEMTVTFWACLKLRRFNFQWDTLLSLSLCESEILSDMYVFFVDTGVICSQPQRQKKMHSFGIGDCFLGGPAVILEPEGRQ